MFGAAWVLSALLFAAKPEVASAITVSSKDIAIGLLVSDVGLSNGFVSRTGNIETFYCKVSNVVWKHEIISSYGLVSLPNGKREPSDAIVSKHQCIPNLFGAGFMYGGSTEHASAEINISTMNSSRLPECELSMGSATDPGSVSMTITLTFTSGNVPRKWRCYANFDVDLQGVRTKEGPETKLVRGVAPFEVTEIQNVTGRDVHLMCSTAPSNPPVVPQYVQWLNSDMEIIGTESNTDSDVISTERTGFFITHVELRVNVRLCAKSNEFFCRVVLPCCNTSVSSETLNISCPESDGHMITHPHLGPGITLSSNWTVPSMEHERFSLIRVLLSVFIPMIKCLDIISAILIYVLCMRKPRKTVDFEDARQHCTGIEAIISTLLLLTIGLGPFTFGIYCRNKKRIDVADAAVFPESKEEPVSLYAEPDELLYNDPNELTMPGDAGYIDTRERRIAHQELQQPKYATDTLSSGSTSDSSPATERQIGVITIVYEDLDV